MKRILALAVLAIGGLVGTGNVADAHWRGGYGGGFRGGYGGYGGGCHSSVYRPSYGYSVGFGAPVYSYPTYGYGTPYYSGFNSYGGYGVPIYGSGYQVYTPGFSVGVWR